MPIVKNEGLSDSHTTIIEARKYQSAIAIATLPYEVLGIGAFITFMYARAIGVFDAGVFAGEVKSAGSAASEVDFDVGVACFDVHACKSAFEQSDHKIAVGEVDFQFLQ